MYGVPTPNSFSPHLELPVEKACLLPKPNSWFGEWWLQMTKVSSFAQPTWWYEHQMIWWWWVWRERWRPWSTSRGHDCPNISGHRSISASDVDFASEASDSSFFSTLEPPQKSLINLDKSELMSPIMSLIFFLSSCAVQCSAVAVSDLWGGPWVQRETVSFYGKGLKSSNRRPVRHLCRFKGDISYWLQSPLILHSSSNRKNSLLLRDQGHYDVHITGHKENYMRQPSFYSFIHLIQRRLGLVWKFLSSINISIWHRFISNGAI